MTKSARVKWASDPQPHDFPAAAAFLALIADPATTVGLVARLRAASTVTHAAKDILRAAHLPLLPQDDPSVAKDLKRIRKHTLLSPVLLVRGTSDRGLPLVIADGYHRVCAAYQLNEDAQVPCRLADPDIP